MRRRCASRESFRTGSVATMFSLSARLGGGACFTGLLLQALAGNANPFLLVRIGRTQAANIRADLPDFSAVRTGHGQMRLLFHGNLNSLWNLEFHGMRVSQREANH